MWSPFCIKAVNLYLCIYSWMRLLKYNDCRRSINNNLLILVTGMGWEQREWKLINFLFIWFLGRVWSVTMYMCLKGLGEWGCSFCKIQMNNYNHEELKSNRSHILLEDWTWRQSPGQVLCKKHFTQESEGQWVTKKNLEESWFQEMQRKWVVNR